MEIHTSLSPNLSLKGRVDVDRFDVAVVIDVLRATSVMTMALAHRAKQIVACLTIDQARQIAAQEPEVSLLCGERACEKIAGFDFGNSPAEYTADRVSGKRLVLTTTNGTRAIQATQSAREVYCASFLNLTKTVTHIQHHRRVQIVCAGTDGFVSGEDVLLAGSIAQRLSTLNPGAKLCDSTTLAIDSWQHRIGGQMSEQTLSIALRETRGGRNLIRLGFDADLQRCAAIDSLPVLVKRVSRDPSCFEFVDSPRG